MGQAARPHTESALRTSWIAGPVAGDVTGSPSGEAFTTSTTSNYFVRALEVEAPAGAHTVVASGDSITAGFITTGGTITVVDPASIDANLRYTDVLARRVADAGLGGEIAVVNAGIGGNRLLSDGTGALAFGGPSALRRVADDVLAVEGATHVIVQVGSNDLGIPPAADADTVIDGLEQLVGELKAAGLVVILATQTPSSGRVLVGLHGLPPAQHARDAINAWTRTQTIADHVVDFHAATADAANPVALAPDLDSGDLLHPNAAGYRAIAAAIDLAMLQ